MIYTTTLPAIFDVKKYAESLMRVVNERNIELHMQTHLIEIDHKNKVAVFEKLDKPNETVRMNVIKFIHFFELFLDHRDK